MVYKYRDQFAFAKSPAKLSKLKQKLSSLIKQKGKYLGEIYKNSVLIKGGIFLRKRKCGKKSCKCAKTDYRHENYYLYRSKDGQNEVVYLKPDRVDVLKVQTKNYQKFRKARENMVKLEKEIMEVINKIEKVKTIQLAEEKKTNEKKSNKG